MLRWQPGTILLSDFDIKIGRLSKQCSALAKSGISFVKRRDGRPRVTWTHVNAALFGDRKIVADEEEKPNFDAI